jgi:uncharacterized protein YjbI with pentapeptide repeats
MNLTKITGVELDSLVELYKEFIASSKKSGKDLDLSCFEFSGYVFEKLSMEQVFIRDSIIDDTRFVDCDLYKSDPSGTKFTGCQFNRCVLSKIEFIDVIFKNCSFNECEFSSTVFIDCIFENCVFENSDTKNAHFGNSQFIETQI